MAYQLTIDYRYPCTALSFYDFLLDFLNFDLLSEFDEAQVSYNPGNEFLEPMSPNFGFIDNESCCFLHNIGSLWIFIPIFIF